MKIRAGGDEFEASGGHVFWVAGRGWVKARDLHEGMRLHTIRGTVAVERIEPGTLQTTYSFVTADFHTFFAGEGMILTHDNTIRPPTDHIVPGLAATACERSVKSEEGRRDGWFGRTDSRKRRVNSLASSSEHGQRTGPRLTPQSSRLVSLNSRPTAPRHQQSRGKTDSALRKTRGMAAGTLRVDVQALKRSPL